jgi:hypothetical protein
MTTTQSVNGRTRKSLAEQIDRLDEILEGLAQSLDAAAAGAVKEAVNVALKESVPAAVLEVLANKELQQRAGVTHTPATQPPPMAVRLTNTARRCWNWLAEAARDTWDSITTVGQVVKVWMLEAANHILATGRAKVQQVRDQVTAGVRVGWMRLVVLATLARQLRRRLPVALGVGVAAGLIAYLAGPLVVPVACGVVGFFGALLVPWEAIPRVTSGPDVGG